MLYISNMLCYVKRVCHVEQRERSDGTRGERPVRPWRQGLLRRGHGERARPDRTPRPGQAGPRHQTRRQAARARGPGAGPRPDDPRHAHAQRAWIGDPARADPAAHPGEPRHRGVPVTAAVRCTDVTKSYRDLRAVDGISFEVRQGEIFGIIGPNGAGKTTLLECIEGLRTRDTGVIEVFGMDPERQTREVRERTGVQLQSAALPTHIKVAETLDLFASFYAAPADWRPLLPRLGLEDKRNTYVDKLSGGQRQGDEDAQALDALQEGGLAGAVGADDPEDLALADLEGDAVDGAEVSVALGDVGAPHRGGHRDSSVPGFAWVCRWICSSRVADPRTLRMSVSRVIRARPCSGSPSTSSLSPGLMPRSRLAWAGSAIWPRSLTVTAP